MKLIDFFAPRKTERFDGAIETWVVEWDSAEPRECGSGLWYVKTHYQAFTSEAEADEFAKSLKLCFKAIRGGVPKIKVYVSGE